MTKTATATKTDRKSAGKIECQICWSAEHHIPSHLTKAHPEVTLEEYKQKYPDAPLFSAAFEERKRQTMAAKKAEEESFSKLTAKILPFTPKGSVEKKPMFEVFGLELDDDMRTTPPRGKTQGSPIMVDVLKGSPETDEEVPEIDEDYVFRPEELKDAVMAIQLNIPLYVWGYHGTGKTTLIEQICARTRRPLVRVQHTETTEEAHIIGQMVVRDGGTEFDYGPLVEAMLNGWVYLADEYDIAHPGIHAVYQPVLEGKPLYIKEAPPGMRLINPHPHFRILATGNTNGSGDDTGLYSGTKMGNAANYSRFGVTIQKSYPTQEVEVAMIVNRIGVKEDIAEKIVDFGNRVREMYGKGELSLPISPRENLRVAQLGILRGGKYCHGINLAYANRLDQVQRIAVQQTAQRVFGD